jgi:hypothetical protein
MAGIGWVGCGRRRAVRRGEAGVVWPVEVWLVSFRQACSGALRLGWQVGQGL